MGAFVAAIFGVLRVGAGFMVRRAIPVAFAWVGETVLPFFAIWFSRIIAALALSGLLPKLISVGLKAGSFAATYAAVRALIYNFISPKLQEVQALFPDSMYPIRYLFQAMYATRELVPWGDFFTAAGIFLEILLAIFAWRLTMWAYSLAGKVLGELGDA